ncbi:MAG: hypothetical protein HYU87_06690 [Chloroflexi bacterium]|nr:hypothetical protein [Chloroflexota bacterium]
MRVHISLDPKVVKEIDRRVGPRKRSRFIAAAVERAIDDKRRWELIESAFGSISTTGHVWDPDPAAWVHAERRRDARRVG